MFKQHDTVFIGKVIKSSYKDVGTLNPKSRVTFEVKSTLKGRLNNNETVVTSVGSVFLEGKEYLVYAYKTTKENYLYKYEEGELATDTMCGGTKELSVANNDLEQIAESKQLHEILYIIIPLVVLFVIITLFLIVKRRGNATVS
ncbi:hypothetical protein D7Z26_15500 [Cohnella endophytica]|uniref:Uncharacterized protein n=1 Tax=Cohnella endophytica TaxID=2419778 RepID=A0A494XZZ5_9BACL|nr:hypothetical protein [Cohnella endophytica]RKP53133.1 hypothetical protein D7Z26_15500 [Cohnella endophytica]